MPKGQTLQTRFNNRVKVNDETGCHEWQGTRDRDGYGVIWTKEKNNNERAHRVAMRLRGVQVPDDKMVLHQCDNPRCVNTDHLTIGDNKQNQIEARDRGRLGDLSEKRATFYRSLTDEEFEQWASRYRGKEGRAISNLTTAKRIRNGHNQ